MEAEILVRFICGLNRYKFLLKLEEKFPRDKYEILESYLKRRIKHEPLQYIIGIQEFYGRKFNVNNYVLIPRSETELSVEIILAEAEKLWGSKAITAIDIGTGSGAIAVTLALEKNNWLIHAVDISHKALKVAEQNADELNAKVIFHQGNLLSPLIEKEIMFDLIISNPPYIPSKELATLMTEVKDFEPIVALDGGDDGLEFYREIIEQSKYILKKPALIAFEVGINQAEQVKGMLYRSGANTVKIFNDYQKIPRTVVAKFE